jgi:hypothetical protein
MSSTTSIVGPQFAAEMVRWMFATIDEATKTAYRMIWDAAMQVFLAHWGIIIAGLIVLLLISFLSAMTTRRWAWFASLLYHYLYFGVLGLIGLIWGPEIYANDYFRIVCVVAYIACFSAVGWVLVRLGLRRRF